MLLQFASLVGVPGEQESTTEPATHDVEPVAAQAPTPQTVAIEIKCSSVRPSQSLSIESQEVSLVGLPGEQESCTEPLTQEVTPVSAQAPMPQLVLRTT